MLNSALLNVKNATDLDAHYSEVSLFTIPSIFGWSANEIRWYCITIAYEIWDTSHPTPSPSTLSHPHPPLTPHPTSCYLLHTLHNEVHLKFSCSTLSIPLNCFGFRQDFSYYSFGLHWVFNDIPQWSFGISGILFIKPHWNVMETTLNLARQIIIG